MGPVRSKASATDGAQTDWKTLLDARGYDGALGFFVPDLSIDFMNAATTDGAVLALSSDANELFSNSLYHLVVCKRASFCLRLSQW